MQNKKKREKFEGFMDKLHWLLAESEEEMSD
jgi:hypothetical protein